MWNKITNIQSTIGIIGAIIGIIIFALIFDFFLFALGYWLITLILSNFFSYILPFTWRYCLGAWLISLILGVCGVLPWNIRIKTGN